MQTSFLVEFRIHGFTKQYAQWTNWNIQRKARNLKIRNLSKNRYISHITLFGPAQTNNLDRVSKIIASTCRNYTLVPFDMGGFDCFQNKDANWLFLDVHPSPELNLLRRELASALINSEALIKKSCQSWDRTNDYKFHSSIGKFSPGDRQKFEKLLEFAKSNNTLNHFKNQKSSFIIRVFKVICSTLFSDNGRNDSTINLYLLRITILSGKGRIQYEYDLGLKKTLNRKQSLSRYWYRRSVANLKQLLARH